MTAAPEEVLIVGAGAAGLWAASRLAEAGKRVLVLEKQAHSGTKILASGGSHCNLTTTLPRDDARDLFGTQGSRFLRHAFRALDPLALRERFRELGVESVEAPLDKVFPASGRARDVRDALERSVLQAGGRILFDHGVESLRSANDGWEVHCENGAHFHCQKLLLCPGGKSFPLTGTTGDGYRWLEELGCEIVPTVPALVPLASKAEWALELSGLALQDAELRLTEESGKLLAKRRRPVLFTHAGLSGPAAMDVSVHVARRPGQTLFASLDLGPDTDREVLRDRLVGAAGQAGGPHLRNILNLDVPRRLLEIITAQAGCDRSNPRVNGLSKAQRHGLVEGLKGLRIPISGTLGFDKAEVTAGGLALSEVEPGTMQLRRHPGLFVFGELLDLDGPIGGLNFQAAFATAELAAAGAGC